MGKVRNSDPQGNIVFHVALNSEGKLQPAINARLRIDDRKTLEQLLSTDNIDAVEISAADGRRYALVFDGNCCKPYPSVMIWRYENKEWGSLIVDMEERDYYRVAPFVETYYLRTGREIDTR